MLQIVVKQNVRYDSIILKVVSYLKFKLGVGIYDFAASVFSLQSSRTLYRYDTFEYNTQDGVLYQTLEQMKDEFDDGTESSDESTNSSYKRWKRIDILKFDKNKN